MTVMEQVFTLPDGSGTWNVRAFEFPTAEAAREVWEKIESESRGKKGNFSIWRTMNPEMTRHFVVVCGRPETLPEIAGGVPYSLDYEHARMFILRRARVGMDWQEEHPSEHLEMEERYGEDNPQVLTEKGGVAPYRP